MQNRDTFSSYHPIINFIYFAMVLLCAMCFMNPVTLCISLGSALCYAIDLNGKQAVRLALRVMIPMMIFVSVINPVFNHQGMTILTYLPSGNPLTLESILYGIASTVMLASVMQWFVCYSAVMTSDKFIYLFGKVIPSLSLVLSMTLRFIPKFKAQIGLVQEAQASIGGDGSQGSILWRMRQGLTVLSILITWSLENAIETADSMRSRGYGLADRTAFSIYTWTSRDGCALLWLLFCGWYVGCGWAVGVFHFQYYPILVGVTPTLFTLSFPAVYLLLCLTPMMVNKQEELAWKRMLTQR